MAWDTNPSLCINQLTITYLRSAIKTLEKGEISVQN